MEVDSQQTNQAEADQYSHLTPRQREHSIFWNYVSLGVDHYQATGEMPDFSQLQALHIGGFIDDNPAELISILDDGLGDEMDFYYDMVKSEAERDSKIDGMLRHHLITRAKADKLPQALFSRVAWQKNSADKKAKPHIVDEIVDDETKITRIRKFYLAKELLADRLNEAELTDDKLVEIVLGVNPVNGDANTKSFAARVCGYNESLTPRDVHLAAHGVWEDYIFPNVKSSHFRQVAETARTGLYSIPAYYDLSNAKLLRSPGEKESYLEEHPEALPYLQKLGDLLLAETPDFKFGKRGQYKEWRSDDYMKYGKFLLGVLKPYKENLSLNVLQRGYDLAIGPHPEGARRQFGTVVNYFQLLSEVHAQRVGGNRRGMFSDWEFADYVDHIKRVAAENEGVLTMAILNTRIENGAAEPSPAMIEKKYGLNTLLAAADLPTFSKTYGPDECLRVGVKFALENNGKAPSEVDMKRTAYLPSDYLIRKHFVKVSLYRDAVRAELARLLSGPDMNADLQAKLLAA